MPNPDHTPRRRAENQGRLDQQTVSPSFLEAAILLVIGLYFWHIGLEGASNSQVYNMSVTVSVWTFLIGGCLLLAATVLCRFGWTPGLIVDAVANLAIGVLLLTCGAIWMLHNDFQGLLLVLVGIVSLNAARGSWSVSLLTHASSPREGIAEDAGELAPEDAAPALTEADMQTKREALRRLLAGKESKAQAATCAPEESPEATSGSPAELAPIVESPPEKPDVAVAQPAPDEGVPDGFLAEFGRDEKR
jgi:hypothetical protein